VSYKHDSESARAGCLAYVETLIDLHQRAVTARAFTFLISSVGCVDIHLFWWYSLANEPMPWSARVSLCNRVC
jgi:hypothetical protein